MNGLVANIFNRTVTHYKKTDEDGWGEQLHNDGKTLENVYIEGERVEYKANNQEVQFRNLIKVYVLEDMGVRLDDLIEPTDSSTEKYKVVSVDKVDFSNIGFTTVDLFYIIQAIGV